MQYPQNFKRLCLALSTAVALVLPATSRAEPASAFSLNFDGIGNTADAFAPIFLTIGYGQFVPNYDGFGDPIPGSEHWELDPSGGPVPVLDSSTVGWGTAPSPNKALDARDGPVLLVFDEPFSFTSFTLRLDNSTFGNLTDTDIRFYDVNNVLLFSAPVNQTHNPGDLVTVGAIGAVKTILLPPTAFYDNIAAVPEPSTVIALISGVGMLFLLRRRRA